MWKPLSNFTIFLWARAPEDLDSLSPHLWSFSHLILKTFNLKQIRIMVLTPEFAGASSPFHLEMFVLHWSQKQLPRLALNLRKKKEIIQPFFFIHKKYYLLWVWTCDLRTTIWWCRAGVCPSLSALGSKIISNLSEFQTISLNGIERGLK